MTHCMCCLLKHLLSGRCYHLCCSATCTSSVDFGVQMSLLPWISLSCPRTRGSQHAAAAHAYIMSFLLSCVDMSAVANAPACVLMGEYEQVAQSPGPYHQERRLDQRGGLHSGGEAWCFWQSVGQDCALSPGPHRQCNQEPLEQHNAPQGGEWGVQVITSHVCMWASESSH